MKYRIIQKRNFYYAQGKSFLFWKYIQSEMYNGRLIDNDLDGMKFRLKQNIVFNEHVKEMREEINGLPKRKVINIDQEEIK